MAREELKYPQTIIADTLEISYTTLASYQDGRAPLRFQLAEFFCTGFGYNQRWLATGDGPKMPAIEFPYQLLKTIEPGSRLSEAYDTILGPHLDAQMKHWAEVIGTSVSKLSKSQIEIIFACGDRPELLSARLFGAQLERDAHFIWLPEDLHKPLLDELRVTIGKFQKLHENRINSHPPRWRYP